MGELTLPDIKLGRFFVGVYFCKSAIINQINEWTGSLVRLMDIRARRGKNHLSRRCIDMGNNRIEEIGGG